MKHQYLHNVAKLEFFPEQCAGCGACVAVCPHRVWGLQDGLPRIKEKDACMECGACAKNCPTQAISVQAGVGCAAAIIWGWLTGNEPSCDGGGGECC